MDELISKQAALECFHDWIDRYGDVHTADEMPEYRAIEALPPTEPQIIRCKDCNFWTKQKDSLQGRCALMGMGIYPTSNWFCGNAERRTE